MSAARDDAGALEFSKMHGAGNDFVVLDLRDTGAPSPALCAALSDRHTGVGCDLILGVLPPRSAHAVASFGIWTSDGTPSRQCGNGARCIAAWLVRAGAATQARFALDSPAATLDVDVLAAGRFRIAMGVPEFAPQHIPLRGVYRSSESYDAELDDGSHVRFSVVSMGNPHAVLEVEDVDAAPVARLGPALRKATPLPPTVNVGFVEVVSRTRIRLRVHEYGAGETLACGSGACAAAAVLMRRGRIDREVAVAQRGGELQIHWPDATGQIFMTGPARFTFEGRFPHASL
jgi:diaminopimelate epimerase/O-ureido-serine racemase